MKSNKSKISCKRGFTLIELLVVVLIIGILAAVALPQYQILIWKIRFSNYIPIIAHLKEMQEVYYLAHGEYASTFEELGVDIPSGASPQPNFCCVGTTVDGYQDKNGFMVYLGPCTVGIIRGNNWVQPYGGLVMTYDHVSGKKDVHGHWIYPGEFNCFSFQNHSQGIMSKVCSKLHTGNTVKWGPVGFSSASIK